MDVNKMAARYKLKMPGATAGGGVPALSSTDLGAAARQSRSRKGSRDSITPPDEPGSSRRSRKDSRAGQGSLPGEVNEGEKKKKRKKKTADGCDALSLFSLCFPAAVVRPLLLHNVC